VELLTRFAQRRDSDAFELLVWRHAGLVWGVCRRVLRQAPDAEDAFQATFLILARKARALRRGGALAGRLHRRSPPGALRAGAATSRRVAVELPDNLAVDPPADPAAAAEARGVLDEEVNRLPAKYRAAVVLCYLQGRSVAEAAAALGCPR